MSRQRVLLALAASAFLLLGSALLLQLFDRVEVEVVQKASLEVTRNPFYAVGLLFEEMGVENRRQIVSRKLPPTDYAMFLVEAPESLRNWDASQLAEWIEGGGHLVFSPDLGSGEEVEEGEPSVQEVDLDEILEDTPLEALGFGVEGGGCPSIRSGAQTEVETGAATLSVSVYSCLLVDHGGEAVLATGRPVSEVPAPAAGEDSEWILEEELSRGEAVAVLRYRRGEGWITVIADPMPLHNRFIGNFDHAEFAWSLVTPEGRGPEGVLFVRAAALHVPSLASMVFGRGWPLLVSGALALGLLLWSRGARFGPVFARDDTERRSLLEHVEATGSFFWRQRLAEVLIASTRDALERRAAQRIPGYGRLERPEQTRVLAERSGLSAGSLATALAPRSIEDPTEITRVLRTLEEARRSI